MVLAQKKTVVDDIQGFAQAISVYDEREVHFEGTKSHGVGIDTVFAQHAEEFAGNTRCMLHPLAHCRHRGQVFRQHGGVHGALSPFACKFGIEQGASARSVLRRDAHRGAGFRGGLRHHKDADAAPGQGVENSSVHADDADHRRAAHRDHAHFVDRGDTAYRAFRLSRIAADDAAASRGVQRVLDKDGDILGANGIDGRGIDHLCPEVAQFHGFAVGQLVDGISCGDDAWICRHETIHVRPYFQRFGVHGSRYDGGGIVRAAAAQVCRGATHGIGCDKSAHDRHRSSCGKGGTNQRVGLVKVDHMLFLLAPRLDNHSGIKVLRPGYQVRTNQRTEPFTIGHDGIRCLGGQILNQGNPMQDAGELVNQGVDAKGKGFAFFHLDDSVNHLLMAGAQLLYAGAVVLAAGFCLLRQCQQAVGDATQCRHHYDDGAGGSLHNALDIAYARGSAHGSASKFQHTAALESAAGSGGTLTAG